MTARYDWTINQGETSSIEVKRILTGGGVDSAPFNANSTFRMQAKDKHGGTAVLSLDNDVAAGGTATDFTFDGSGNATARNNFHVNISATASAAIAAGKYVYDIENVSSNDVTRVLEGTLIVTPEVTT